MAGSGRKQAPGGVGRGGVRLALTRVEKIWGCSKKAPLPDPGLLLSQGCWLGFVFERTRRFSSSLLPNAVKPILFPSALKGDLFVLRWDLGRC